MSAATCDIERPIDAPPPLSEADRAHIMAEQRACNVRAIRLYAQEHRVVGRASRALLQATDYWQGDATEITRGHLALTRLSTLIEYAGLSEIAGICARRWIDDARTALARFETPLGPSIPLEPST